VAAGAGFVRQPWGAPFALQKDSTSSKLLFVSVLGFALIQFFTLAYAKVFEWITHRPLPLQKTLSFIKDALGTNPLTVILVMVLFAPIAEEVIFRGLLFGALSKRLSTLWTILVTSLLFAAIHLQLAYFFPIFLLGIVCGWARFKSGKLSLPILLHVLNNGISLFILRFYQASS